MYVCVEYDTMDIPMLKEVIQMLRQQLEKAQVDRNYVQHERVRTLVSVPVIVVVQPSTHATLWCLCRRT